jgi:pimeloyl-ACP methyl ester carboxylesterase
VVAAHDLESVRKALGYAKIHIRGGSYGTRLGLELVRQHASSLAAIVLDGLATPDWDFFSDAIKITDRMVAQLVADCAKDASCTAVAPDLAADLSSLRQSFKLEPRPITVGGKATTETEEDFRVALHMFVNDDYWRFDVPRAIHKAALGDFALWNALLSDLEGAKVASVAASLPPSHGGAAAAVRRRLPRFFRGAPEYVAPALYISAVCAEDFPNSPGLTALQALADQQDWGAGLGTSMIDIAKACPSWKVTSLDAALRTPVSSSVPALLLSGGVDFITPPEAGDHAAATLSNSTHLVIPNMTHAAMRSSCAASILTAFLAADGDMASVDTSCLQKLPAASW